MFIIDAAITTLLMVKWQRHFPENVCSFHSNAVWFYVSKPDDMVGQTNAMASKNGQQFHTEQMQNAF